MSKALRILHGEFGRAMLTRLDRSVTVHAHRTCQLLFRIDGPEIEVSVRGQRYRLGGDEVVMLNAWEPYSYEVLSEQDPSTIMAIYIDPTWLKRQDRRLSNSMHTKFFTVPCGEAPPSTLMVVNELVNLIAYEADPSTLDVEALILETVFGLTSKFSNLKSLSSFDMVGGVACDARIRKILSIMRDSVGEPIVIEDLAKTARMSRPHFFHLFKQETQITPMIYSSMIRMERAVQKISETTDSMFDISQLLGFESPGNFTRFFNMHQGISPSQYRRSVTILQSALKIQKPKSILPDFGFEAAPAIALAM